MRQWIARLKPSRPVVAQWKLADFVPRLEELSATRSLEAGQKAFRDVGCAQCHRIGQDGGTVGPDLSTVARRLSPRELLEAVVEPSAKIADEYANWLVQTEDGHTLTGRIEREDDDVLVLRPTSSFDAPVPIEKRAIAGRRKSDVSNMPAGIINVLQPHEVLDLVAYLISCRGE